MIRGEGSYELESLPSLCVSHAYRPVDTVSSAELLHIPCGSLFSYTS